MEADTKPSAVTLPDRRRPGRVGYDNPDLIALMRGKIPFDDPARPLDEEDDLRFARGLSLALLVVVPFWALVGFGVWWLVG